MNIGKLKQFRYIFLHIALGILASTFTWFSTVWVSAVFFGAIIITVSNRNKWGTAHLAAAYIVGIELLLRMTKASLPYEFGKYAVILLLLIGIGVERGKRKLPLFGLLYILALVPSIFVIEYHDFELSREQIAFNLSGPFCLFMTLYYFYKRPLDSKELSKVLLFFVYPVISMFLVIYLKLPNFSEYTFKTQSDSTLSGGFGANQVAVITAFAFMVFPMCWLLNIRVTQNRMLDLGIAMTALTSSFLTFSRGGLVTAALSLIVAMLITMSSGRKVEQIKRILIAGVVVGVLGTVSFIYLNSITHGALESRYIHTIDPNATNPNEVKAVDVSGRDEIVKLDFKIFTENPLLGVGPGMAAYKYRDNLFGKGLVAAHTEQTRLLAEHGLYGIIALVCIFIYPIGIFKKMSVSGKVIASALIIFSFITMTHNATRLAIVGFCYGLAFIDYQDKSLFKSNPLIRSGTS